MKFNTLESLMSYIFHNSLIAAGTISLWFDVNIAIGLFLLSISISLREQGGKIAVVYRHLKKSNFFHELKLKGGEQK